MGLFLDTKALEIINHEVFSRCSPVQRGNTDLTICCPIHTENTPSCHINLSAHNVPVGWVHCLGCEYNQPWNVFAKQLGWQQISNGSTKEIARIAPNAGIRLQRLKQQMLGDATSEPEWETIEPSLRNRLLNDVELTWRTIEPELANTLGFKRIIMRDGEPFMVMPVHMNRQLIGIIRGRWIKSDDKAVKSYLNSPGQWVKKTALLGYDYFQTLDMWKQHKFVLVVEGPRDALVLLQAGIPAVSILGNNWSLEKLEYLMGCEPRLIVTLMDNDKTGRKLARKIKADCKKRFAPCLVVKLPPKEKIGKKLDPAALKPKQRKQVLSHIMKHL